MPAFGVWLVVAAMTVHPAVQRPAACQLGGACVSFFAMPNHAAAVAVWLPGEAGGAPRYAAAAGPRCGVYFQWCRWSPVWDDEGAPGFERRITMFVLAPGWNRGD